MSGTRGTSSAVCTLALSLAAACSSSEQPAYEQSVDCVANEIAWHMFLDQTRDPAHMFEADGARFVTLRSRAERDGAALGLTKGEIGEDIRLRARAEIADDRERNASEAAMARNGKARLCLDEPTGSTIGPAA